MATYEILGGPSKWDLMLALFDVEHGPRTVRFKIKARTVDLQALREGSNPDYTNRHDLGEYEEGEFDVTVSLIKRRDRANGSDTIGWWEICGKIGDDYADSFVANFVHIEYYMHSRKGNFRVERSYHSVLHAVVDVPAQ